MSLEKSSDGRMVCTGLIVGLDAYGPDGKPTEVTSRALRGIPVAELIGRAMTEDPVSDHHAPLRRMVLARAPEARTLKRQPGPKGHPDDHYPLGDKAVPARPGGEPRGPDPVAHHTP